MKQPLSIKQNTVLAKKKFKVNWYLLAAAVIILYYNLSGAQGKRHAEIKRISVHLSKDIINVKGSRSPTDYKFWTTEYENQFNILNGSISRGKHREISNLKRGQQIEVSISTSDYDKLKSGTTDISVRGLRVNEKTLMSTQEFSTNRKLYKKRLNLISILTGIMLLLNSLIPIPRKMNYVIVISFIGALVLMYYFKFGLY